jgi:hypothetical protein
MLSNTDSSNLREYLFICLFVICFVFVSVIFSNIYVISEQQSSLHRLPVSIPELVSRVPFVSQDVILLGSRFEKINDKKKKKILE